MARRSRGWEVERNLVASAVDWWKEGEKEFEVTIGLDVNTTDRVQVLAFTAYAVNAKPGAMWPVVATIRKEWPNSFEQSLGGCISELMLKLYDMVAEARRVEDSVLRARDK